MNHHSDKALDSLVSLLLDGQSKKLSELSKKVKLTHKQTESCLGRLVSAGFPIEFSDNIAQIKNQRNFLDAQTLYQGIEPSAQANLHSLDVFRCVDSTNDYLLAQTHDGNWKVAVAEYQTHGKGRRGRNWESQFDEGICISLGRQFPEKRLVPLSLVAGVAAATTLRALGADEIGLKWPNDVVARDCKLGGILTESRSVPAGVIAVIGVGLNYRFLRRPGELSEYGVIDLAELCKLPSRSQVCCQLISTLINEMTRYIDVGFGPFHKYWENLDAFAGRHVYIKENETHCDGIADGIDADGAFRLRIDSRIRRFVVGEVSLRLQS